MAAHGRAPSQALDARLTLPPSENRFMTGRVVGGRRGTAALNLLKGPRYAVPPENHH